MLGQRFQAHAPGAEAFQWNVQVCFQPWFAADQAFEDGSLSAKEAESPSRAREPEPEVPSAPLTQYEQDGKISLGDVIDLSGLGKMKSGRDEESEDEG